jgi:hypothetical protein
VAIIEEQAKQILHSVESIKQILTPKEDEDDKENKPIITATTLPDDKQENKKRKIKKGEKDQETKLDELMPIDDKSDPKYTCVCGKELSISSRKRHEKTAAHTLFLVTGQTEM